MAGPFFREWRKERMLTLEQVAGRLADLDDPQLPQTAASLSRLETGKQPYNQRIIEALAFIYGIEAHELIGSNPKVWDELEHASKVLNGMDEVGRRRAIKLLEALRDTAAAEAAATEEEDTPPPTPEPAPPRKRA